MTVYVIGHQNCPTTAQLLPWSQSCHMVQFLRKSRSTLIFLLAGDSLKKLFDSFAQFFTKQHKKNLIISKIDYSYLAGFLCRIMFPERTLKVLVYNSKIFPTYFPIMDNKKILYSFCELLRVFEFTNRVMLTVIIYCFFTSFEGSFNMKKACYCIILSQLTN